MKKFYLENSFGIIQWMIMNYDSKYFIFKLDSHTRLKAKIHERFYFIYKNYFQQIEKLNLQECALSFPKYEQVLKMKIYQKDNQLSGRFVYIRTNSISKEFRIVNLNHSDIIQFSTSDYIATIE